MFRIFYAAKDATLYESLPTYNTGIDEILEIGKRLGTDGATLLKSRSVIKFDMPEISASLSTYGKAVTDCKFVLQLFTSDAKNLPAELLVYVLEKIYSLSKLLLLFIDFHIIWLFFMVFNHKQSDTRHFRSK